MFTDTITIINPPIASITYPEDTLFVGDDNVTPEIFGLTGVFTAIPDGIIFADDFGTIDLINSTREIIVFI
ncbi:MAG: hypothetical protein IPO24_04370 [Bacteroidetes bacterium]|nr:hypothetical protein [Bacteroidota bacterium]